MNEFNVAAVCIALAVGTVAISTATWAIKTAGIDTNLSETSQIEACVKNGGTYISGRNGEPQCVQTCMGFK